MLRYIIARLLGLVGVLLSVSLITFVLMHAVPGGPFDALAIVGACSKTQHGYG